MTSRLTLSLLKILPLPMKHRQSRARRITFLLLTQCQFFELTKGFGKQSCLSGSFHTLNSFPPTFQEGKTKIERQQKTKTKPGETDNTAHSAVPYLFLPNCQQRCQGRDTYYWDSIFPSNKMLILSGSAEPKDDQR